LRDGAVRATRLRRVLVPSRRLVGRATPPPRSGAGVRCCRARGRNTGHRVRRTPGGGAEGCRRRVGRRVRRPAWPARGPRSPPHRADPRPPFSRGTVGAPGGRIRARRAGRPVRTLVAGRPSNVPACYILHRARQAEVCLQETPPTAELIGRGQGLAFFWAS